MLPRLALVALLAVSAAGCVSKRQYNHDLGLIRNAYNAEKERADKYAEQNRKFRLILKGAAIAQNKALKEARKGNGGS